MFLHLISLNQRRGLGSNQKPAPSFRSFPKPIKASRPNLLRKKDKKKKWEIVREKVIESARVGDRYQCSLCGGFFPRNEICADHIQSRGARPDLFLDPTNLRACCMFCNQSDNPNRFS